METQEKKGIKVLFSFENKKVLMRVENPKQSIKLTIENIKEQARRDPEKIWHLPEMDPGDNINRYYLGRINEKGEKEVFREKKDGMEQSLFDYGVKEGDQLIIIKRVIAGGN